MGLPFPWDAGFASFSHEAHSASLRKLERQRWIEAPPRQHLMPFFSAEFRRAHFFDEAPGIDLRLLRAEQETARPVIDPPAFTIESQRERRDQQLQSVARGDIGRKAAPVRPFKKFVEAGNSGGQGTQSE